jgi:hypothetical protein
MAAPAFEVFTVVYDEQMAASVTLLRDGGWRSGDKFAPSSSSSSRRRRRRRRRLLSCSMNSPLDALL